MKKQNVEYEYVAQNVCFTMVFGATISGVRPASERTDRFHKHALYELFFVEKAEQSVHFEEEKLVLHAGDFLLVRPDTLHYADEWTEKNYISCQFSVDCSENTDATLAAFLAPPYRYFRADMLCALLMRRLTEALQQSNGVAAGSSLAALLFRAAELCAASKVQDISRTDSPIGRIYKIEEALYSYYTDELPLSLLAEKMHLSERQLSRIIKKHYGVGYRAKNKELRMQSAARHLLRGESAASVADLLGYRSKSAFYAAFRAYYGCSPAAYRAQTKEKDLPTERQAKGEGGSSHGKDGLAQ